MTYKFGKVTGEGKYYCEVLIIDDKKQLDTELNDIEQNKLERKLNDKKKIVSFDKDDHSLFLVFTEDSDDPIKLQETARKSGNEIFEFCSAEKVSDVMIGNRSDSKEYTNSLIEGFLLSNYAFNDFYSNDDKKTFTVENINIDTEGIDKDEVQEIINTVDGVHITRTLVNLPQNKLTAHHLAESALENAEKFGFKAEVFDKKKIESLQMGGLLAVNKGSIEPPTFSILEWSPENAKNEKPIILVGKGVVYDTGGLSLKGTAGSMDAMKSDMAGAAAVIGAFVALAANNLPLKVIGLIPATDNRPDGSAYAPGDVIKMYNGKFVEVMNTDAEGRMILADALSYGDQYEPELIMTIATLTGAASAAVGQYGTVVMGNADRNYFNELSKAGLSTYERTVEFPFWEEYGEMIKSPIADMKNIGGKVAGAITAGKFLENFTKSPYIHMDIAGPAFLTEKLNYRGIGGTGTGVRLFYDFLKRLSK